MAAKNIKPKRTFTLVVEVDPENTEEWHWIYEALMGGPEDKVHGLNIFCVAEGNAVEELEEHEIKQINDEEYE